MLASAGPMLEADGAVFSKRWGYLSRAGLNDKSQMTRQIEKYADIFTSRSGRHVSRSTVCAGALAATEHAVGLTP